MMTDIQLYQSEPEERLQDEFDSDCFEESGIIEERARRTDNTNWCLCTAGLGDIRAFDFSPSCLQIWYPVQP